MACLHGCNECDCVEVKPCDSNETVEADVSQKLKVLKQFACVIKTTPCPKLPQMLGKYAWFVWCFLKDVVKLILSLRRRTDDLYDVTRCLDGRITQITNFLIEQAKGNVVHEVGSSTSGGGSIGGPATYMTSTTDREGNFTFEWNMTQTNGVVGNGVIRGKINQSYSVDDNGNMVVDIQSVVINSVSYTPTGLTPGTSQNGNIEIHGIYSKSYSTGAAFNDVINKEVPFNSRRVVAPHSSTGRIDLFNISDTWVGNPTHGVAYVSYTNNNDAIPSFGSCPIEPKC